MLFLMRLIRQVGVRETNHPFGFGFGFGFGLGLGFGLGVGLGLGLGLGLANPNPNLNQTLRTEPSIDPTRLVLVGASMG